VYDYTRRFAKAMAEHNWMVITGAGPDGYVMALQTAVRLAGPATTETSP
jgi:3-dehydroquinate dehydratase